MSCRYGAEGASSSSLLLFQALKQTVRVLPSTFIASSPSGRIGFQTICDVIKDEYGPEGHDLGFLGRCFMLAAFDVQEFWEFDEA